MDREIEYLSREISRQFRRPGASMETKEWANEQLREISADFETVRRPDGYQDFLLDVILRERERFRATEDELEDLPYSSIRAELLCSCRNSECPLKEGEIPREIREAASFERGLRRFKQSHRGDPIVLREARSDWNERVSRVKTTLRRVLSALSNNQIPGEPVDDDRDQEDVVDEVETELEADV